MLRMLLICIGFLFLAGCSLDTLPDDAKVEYERILEAVSSGDWDTIRENLHPDISEEAFDPVVEWVEDYTGGQPYESYSIVSLNYSRPMFSTGELAPTTYTVDFVLQYPEQAMGMSIVLEQIGDDLVIQNFRVAPHAGAATLEDLPEFTVADKPTWQKVFLGLMIFMPLFLVVTIIAAIRTRKIHRRPIVWSLLLLFGVGEVEMIWETGAWSFQLLTFGLLGAGFSSDFANPGWVMSLYFPLFALIFWYNRITGKVSPKVAAEQVGTEK